MTDTNASAAAPDGCRRPCRAALLWILFSLLFGLAAAEGVFRWRIWRETSSRPGVFELYSVGESTMAGVPFYLGDQGLVSPARLAAGMFGDKLRGRQVKDINLSFGGNSSYPQSLKFRRAVKYRDRRNPGAVLIYLGHNEQLSVSRPAFRHRAYAFFRDRILARSFVLSEAAFRLERYCGYLGGRDLAHYEFRLRAVIEAAREAGLTPVIATLACNASSFEPDGAEQVRGLRKALAIVRSGGLAEAERRYRYLLGRYEGEPGEAYMLYLLGRCLEKKGLPAEAAVLYLAALEKDPLPFRARPAQNHVIRKLAAEYGLTLVDAEAAFRARSRRALPGDDLFVDHVHPNQEGYLLLASLLAEGLGKALGETPTIKLAAGKVYSPPGLTGRERALPYLYAGTYVLWFSCWDTPLPDRLALAERNFRKALAFCPGHDLASIGLRSALLARRSGESIPAGLGRWFRGERPVFEKAEELPGGKRQELEDFLGGLERR